MKTFPITILRLAQIRPDPDNVYKHNADQQARLRQVIETHGNLQPIVVDADSLIEIDNIPTYQLVGGEARLHAYQDLGLDVTPTILATFPSEAHRKAAAIALNPPYGYFDEDELDRRLISLQQADLDLSKTGIEPERWAGFSTNPGITSLGSDLDGIDPSTYWPTIQVRVPADILTRFEKCLAQYEGPPHEQLRQALQTLATGATP